MLFFVAARDQDVVEVGEIEDLVQIYGISQAGADGGQFTNDVQRGK